jgi:uncharacterized protein GlcG (DUF336 family)
MFGGRMVPEPGGVLVRGAAGTIPGAVGISDDTSVNAEPFIVHGIEVVGLTADTGGGEIG